MVPLQSINPHDPEALNHYVKTELEKLNTKYRKSKTQMSLYKLVHKEFSSSPLANDI